MIRNLSAGRPGVPAGNKDEYFSRKQRRVYAKFYASQIPLFLICGIYNATFLA